jgi:hypothetical protein
MAVTTLSNLVLKTAQAGNVKLLVPADRIGAVLGTAIDSYPTTFLSQGHFPMPRLTEPEHRSRQVVVEPSMPPATGPASSAGSLSGVSVSHGSLPAYPSATRTGASRASCPWSRRFQRSDRSDCQSPDRHADTRNLQAKPRAGWQRTMARTTATGK